MLAKLDIQEYFALEEGERVYAWREEELVRAGYDEDIAALIAARTDVDLHLAVELVQHGCPVTTALHILR